MDKLIRGLFENRTNDIDLVIWSEPMCSYVPRKASDGQVATSINEQYDAFCDGHSAKAQSERVSVGDQFKNAVTTALEAGVSEDTLRAMVGLLGHQND